MKSKLTSILHFALSALVTVVSFSHDIAHAYTSSGVDGIFQPATSVVIDLSQPVFNFTSIYIPSGVTVSFGGLSSPQTFFWLATGNIDIAGTLDLGLNSIWIETPGNLSISGGVNASSGTLTLTSGTVNTSGVFNIPGGSSVSINRGGSLSDIGNISLLPGSNISLLPGGNISLLPGGDITIRNPGATIVSPVPEPAEWAMLFLGLFVIFAALRTGKQNTQIALS